MNSRKKNARIAGLWYLLMAVTGGFGIMYAPMGIMVSGDAAATAQKLIESEWIYRLSIVSNLVGQVCFIFLVFALNRLLEDVNPKQAKLMVTLVIIAVPIAFINTLNLVAAQLFVSRVDFLNVFEVDKLNALSMVFLKLYEHGILIVQIFWGLWLLPFGFLIIKSQFIPRVIGILLIVGCFAYLLASFIGLLWPAYNQIASSILMLPISIGEFSIVFWLLITGVKTTNGELASTV
jgi:hypothetical protein